MHIPLQNNKPYVLVTGGAGYIGSHCCKKLSQHGFIPVVLDNLSTGHKNAVLWGPFIQGDISDKSCLDAIFEKYKPIAVMHFAASAIILESIKNPDKYYQNNVLATIPLLNACKRHEIKKIIFSSSCSTYGIPKKVPVCEDTAQNPISPYGRSKLMIEQILQDFDTAFDFRFVALRYFNAAGADFEGQIGENHTNETHLIPLIIQNVLGQKDHVKIYGTSFDTPDGSAVRDYVHVQDLADAHLKALQWLMVHKTSLSLNLGTNQGFSVLEILKAIENHCQTPIPVKFLDARKGDPAILVADYTKAKQLLHWTPKYSNLDSIISSALNYHKKQQKTLCAKDPFFEEKSS